MTLPASDTVLPPPLHPLRAGWTEERITLLKSRWAAGASCSQIAAELGDVSRNAVIGKIHRLGLSGPSRPEKERPARQARPQARRGPERKPARPTRPLVPPELYRPLSDRDLAAPNMRPCSLLELMESMCRFPIGVPGAPDFRFCGANAALRLDHYRRPRFLPYCAFHTRIAYLPVVERAVRRSAA
jgi:GcrA cell cycle regulator